MILAAIALLFPFAEVLSFHVTPFLRIRFLDILILLYCTQTVMLQIRNVTRTFIWKSSVLCIAIPLILSSLANGYSISFSSLMYLFRTVLYLVFFALINHVNKEERSNIAQYFTIGCLILLVTGIMQYILYPSLRNLMYLGYDPHTYRLFGLFLDPNLIGLAFAWSTLYFMRRGTYPLALAMTIALLLTYSRISYIALISAGVYWALMRPNFRRIGLIILASVVFITTIFLLPKRQGEGTNIVRINSIMSKVSALRTTQSVLEKKPFFGIGFNTLASYALKGKFVNNSQFGLDSSFLTVLTTSGILGAIGYFAFFFQTLRKSNVLFGAITIAYFVHSLSTNSFFTPTLFTVFAFLSVITLEPTRKQ